MAKTKYETIVEPNLILIGRWKRNGISEEEIAKKLGIAYSTFRIYAEQQSALSAVLKKGQEIVDTEVENALLKRALGYDYEETTQELKEGQLVTTKAVRKHVVGDVGAQAFWLKNRAADKWRDKPSDEPDCNGATTGVPMFEFVFKDMSMKDENNN